jgi:hypothetical protein
MDSPDLLDLLLERRGGFFFFFSIPWYRTLCSTSLRYIYVSLVSSTASLLYPFNYVLPASCWKQLRSDGYLS